jgi:hypothetical protein
MCASKRGIRSHILPGPPRRSAERKGTKMTMSRCSLLVRVLVIVTFAGFAPTAFAQSGASTILGNVVDQTGQPIKGVRVSARSDTQIGGPKVAYTKDDGGYRIPGLIPGFFEVTASAPKLKSVVVKNVEANASAPGEADIIMEVESGVEEVKVVQKPPVVSTTQASVRTTYDENFLDQMPSNFKLGAESVIANAVPGANLVVGSTRLAQIRGGNANQTAYLVEGFDMAGQRSTIKGMASVDVQSAAYGAEYASVPGGIVSMVTKSGSNKFEFDFNSYLEHNDLNLFTDNLDSKGLAYFIMINPNVSGPIIKDKLWYFVNIEARREQYADIPDPLGLLPTNPDRVYGSVRGSGKFTWQISPRNKLVSFNNFNLRTNVNQGRGYAPAVEHEAQYRTDDQDIFTGLIWESLLSDSVFFKSQLGYQRFWDQVNPTLCGSNPDCDNIPAFFETVPRALNENNFGSHTQTITDKIEFINTLELFPGKVFLGEHDIRVKNDFITQSDEFANSWPGDRHINLAMGQPVSQVEFFANDPRYENPRYGWFIRTGTTLRNQTSLSDQWKVTRHLTLTPGVAVIKSRASNSNGDVALDAWGVTPHLAAVWDATHDGKTAIRASFANYLDTGIGGLPADTQALSRFTVDSPVTRNCRWDGTAFTAGCTYSGGSTGRTVGSPCGTLGVDATGAPCRTSLRLPRTWEYSAGAEREIFPGIALSGDFVYRLFTHPYETLETNRIWNASGTTLADATLTNPAGSTRNGRPTAVIDLETPNGAKREYLGFTVGLNRREGRLRTYLAYTLSYNRGNVGDAIDNPYGNIGGRDQYLWGYLPQDSRHNIRAQVTWAFTKWASLGVLYDYHSGNPYYRRFINAYTMGYDDYRATNGINPGANLNDPSDDRALRLPDNMLLNLQGRINWKPLLGVDLETYVDVINALAERTPLLVQSNDGPDWGTMQARMDPFHLRIGLRYHY